MLDRMTLSTSYQTSHSPISHPSSSLSHRQHGKPPRRSPEAGTRPSTCFCFNELKPSSPNVVISRPVSNLRRKYVQVQLTSTILQEGGSDRGRTEQRSTGTAKGRQSTARQPGRLFGLVAWHRTTSPRSYHRCDDLIQPQLTCHPSPQGLS